MPAVTPRKAPHAGHALAVTAAMWGLYLYWFVFAERARIFLYGHLNATPFDTVTSDAISWPGWWPQA
jgi:hypothetical protein